MASPIFVDTHCHLDSHYFPEGADAVIARARAAGVVGFVCIGVGEKMRGARDAIALAERVGPSVVATAGVHPHDASVVDDDVRAELASLAEHPRVVAVGEMGLDYHYDHSPRDVQQRVFAEQIALAKRVRKPIVLHTREAADDTLAILESEGVREVGGVVHCFSEDRAFAERALAMGLHLSFSGIVTFKNAKSIHEVAAWAPLDRILVETDAPYLAPIPFRGKPCEPAHVVYTAKRVAELRGITIEELAAATTANASKLFAVAPASC
jgi:TatD DNase family protein